MKKEHSTTIVLDEIIDRIQDGDVDVFDELLTTADHRLRRLTSQLLFSRYPRFLNEECEDLLHDALIKIRTKFELGKLQVTSTSSFFALVGLHFRRELADLGRRRQRMPWHIEKHDTGSGSFGPDFVASDSADPKHIAQWTELHELANQLDGMQKRVFNLVFYCGFTTKQVAGMLGISVRSIQLYWRQARITLSELIDLPLPE